jgi:hypothetical protein
VENFAEIAEVSENLWVALAEGLGVYVGRFAQMSLGVREIAPLLFEDPKIVQTGGYVRMFGAECSST